MTDNNVVSAVVTLKQVSDPGLETVTAAATGPVVHEAYTTTAKFGPLAAGGSETITFHLDWDAPVEGLIVLDLDCATAAGECWRRHVSHDLVRKPEPPTEWEKRRDRARG